MLTESEVLNYIKTRLASPYIPLELDDNHILNIVRQQTIRYFSRYIPDLNKIGMDLTDPKYQTDVPNEYLIIEPDGLEIMNINKIYMDSGNLIVIGYPIIGLFGGDYNQVVDYALSVEKAGTISNYSALSYTVQWVKPNKIRISPNYTGKLVLEYERFHKPDFSTIPSEFQIHFLDLAYAHVAQTLVKIRSQFREVQTPFGTVELNTDKLEEESRDIIEKITEEIKLYNPPIIIDRG